MQRHSVSNVRTECVGILHPEHIHRVYMGVVNAALRDSCNIVMYRVFEHAQEEETIKPYKVMFSNTGYS